GPPGRGDGAGPHDLYESRPDDREAPALYRPAEAGAGAPLTSGDLALSRALAPECAQLSQWLRPSLDGPAVLRRHADAAAGHVCHPLCAAYLARRAGPWDVG